MGAAVWPRPPTIVGVSQPQSQFVDEVALNVRGGDGGAGAVSMRREVHVPVGGPDDHDDGSVLGALVPMAATCPTATGSVPHHRVSLCCSSATSAASSNSRWPTFAVPAPR